LNEQSYITNHKFLSPQRKELKEFAQRLFQQPNGDDPKVGIISSFWGLLDVWEVLVGCEMY
jgi:hypothetical protein